MSSGSCRLVPCLDLVTCVHRIVHLRKCLLRHKTKLTNLGGKKKGIIKAFTTSCSKSYLSCGKNRYFIPETTVFALAVHFVLFG